MFLLYHQCSIYHTLTTFSVKLNVQITLFLMTLLFIFQRQLLDDHFNGIIKSLKERHLKHLIPDISIISECGKANIVMEQKLNYFVYLLNTTSHTTNPSSSATFYSTNPPSNGLGLSFTKNVFEQGCSLINFPPFTSVSHLSLQCHISYYILQLFSGLQFLTC